MSKRPKYLDHQRKLDIQVRRWDQQHGNHDFVRDRDDSDNCVTCGKDFSDDIHRYGSSIETPAGRVFGASGGYQTVRSDSDYMGVDDEELL